MKAFGITFVCLIIASVFAWWLMPGRDPLHRTHLVWVSDDNPARRDHIVKFNELNPDCLLSLDPALTDSMEKVIVQATGGVGPDLFDCYAAFQLAAYVQADVAWDVTDQLARAHIDLTKECWPALLPLAVYHGRVYGFPANAATDALYFNKDIFDRMHVPYPKGPMTWEQFIPLAQKLTIRGDDGRVIQYGFSFDFGQWRDFLVQWGGHIYSPDGTRCVLDSPQAIASMQFQWDLVYKYKVMPSASDEDAASQTGGWGSTTMKFLGNGRIATAMGGRWWLCTMRNYSHLNLGACEAPHGPQRVFFAYGKATCINKQSPNREKALKFLIYMASKPYNDLVNQQADGVAPIMKYCTDASLNNPNYPNEDFHGVFRDEMSRGVSEPISPFCNTAVAERIFAQQLDLIRRNAKSPEAGMKEMAREVNEEIAKTLARNPALKAEYDALIAREKSQPKGQDQ